jgi:hypothetical protein
MTPDWKRITDPTDPLYDAVNPYFEAAWGGNDQLTGASTGVAAISIGPDGQQDGYLHWTFAVSTNAPAGKYPGGRRYVCQRIDPSWAPHVQ